MASIPLARSRRGPAPTGQTPVTSVRLRPDLASGLASWIADQPEPRPGRSTAINEALRDWLTARGYLERPDAIRKGKR